MINVKARGTLSPKVKFRGCNSGERGCFIGTILEINQRVSAQIISAKYNLIIRQEIKQLDDKVEEARLM